MILELFSNGIVVYGVKGRRLRHIAKKHFFSRNGTACHSLACTASEVCAESMRRKQSIAFVDNLGDTKPKSRTTARAAVHLAVLIVHDDLDMRHARAACLRIN